MISHALNQLGEKNVKFIVETECSEEKSISVPVEGVSQASEIRIITEFVQMIVHETDI